MLRNQATRREFLSDPSHRIRFVFLPKHSSWLNQIEVIFGIVMRKVMRRGNFPSVADLEEKLRMFLKYFNETMAHPFAWTYTGRPTASRPPPPFCPPHRRTADNDDPQKSHWRNSLSDGQSIPICGTRQTTLVTMKSLPNMKRNRPTN